MRQGGRCGRGRANPVAAVPSTALATVIGFSISLVDICGGSRSTESRKNGIARVARSLKQGQPARRGIAR